MITIKALIDRQALKHNYQQLLEKSLNKKIVAVVKGDAYGHGAVEVARTLTEIGAEKFAVSRIEEAVELRDAGITQPILLLEGCFCQQDVVLASKYGFEPVVHHMQQVQDIENADVSSAVKVWLKLDTGMHRIGVQPEEFAGYVARLERCPHVAAPVNAVSHFCRADEPDARTTLDQLAVFTETTALCRGEKTIANSAGILYWPESHFDWVRAGIALYGASPNENQSAEALNLQPVMTLESQLIAVRSHKAGAPVGYGETWVAKNDTKIGVIAVGYGDGYPRSAPIGTPVYINGRIVPLVGRVSMDMMTVDLGADSTEKVGDRVELWGKNLPVSRVAKKIGTISYELMIQLTRRVPRIYE